MFDPTDLLEKNLERQLSFVRASETRVQFVFPSITATFALWVVGYYSIDFSFGWAVLCGTLSLLGIVLSVFHLWKAMFPQTNGPTKSNIFFGGIASKPLDEFRASIHALDEEQYRSDLVEQIHINATIAKSKFNSVQYSLMFWFISLPFLALFLVLTILDVNNASGLQF